MPKIFIGHGRSLQWQELRRFLAERLQLPCDDFDATSGAGKSISERLDEMLDDSCFAFLVMTAEDEHADGSHHARENVVHEVGLFQGRLGRQKAIVLLEDGCHEFSNIHGLIQIRFPTGDIMARSEQIRQVLERESILGPAGTGLANADSLPRRGEPSLEFFEDAYWRVRDGKIDSGPFCSRCHDVDGKDVRMRQDFIEGVSDMDEYKHGGHVWFCPGCGQVVDRNPSRSLKAGSILPNES